MLMDLYRRFTFMDETTDASIAVWETKCTEVSTDLDNSLTLLNTVLATMDQATKAAATAAVVPRFQAVSPRILVVDTLKPFVLSLQNTPVEFRQWKRKLDAFFSTSHLGLANTLDQQAYVRQFLNSDLDARIASLLLSMEWTV